METFLKTMVILLLLTPISLNAQLQPSTVNSEFPNSFTAQSSPQPNIGVNGRGIFTGTPLASRQGPRVTLHSYPWLTYNKLVNADNTGKILVYNEDTSFSLPPQLRNSQFPSIPDVPSIPGIPQPPKLPNFPKIPAPVRSPRKTRSVITPQIIQAQTAPNFQLGTAFPSHGFPQFPSFPFSYPIPYTIITQVIPVFPAFGVAVQPPPPMVTGEASGDAKVKEVPKPEIETGGEFSGATEIEGPYPDPVVPDVVSEGDFSGEAEIQGPYPDSVKPDVSGDASGGAMLAYPAALPEAEGEAIMSGPYPAPIVSGESSGSAMIQGPYPDAIIPEVSSEAVGPYPIAKPTVSGEASGSSSIKGPYKSPANTKKTSIVRRPNPVPVKSVVNVAGATVNSSPPVTVKPLEENPAGLKEFLLELEKPAAVVNVVGGEKNKGPYLIPKKPVTGVDLGELPKPVLPTVSKRERISFEARVKSVVYPEYLRDSSGRIVKLN